MMTVENILKKAEKTGGHHLGDIVFPRFRGATVKYDYLLSLAQQNQFPESLLPQGLNADQAFQYACFVILPRIHLPVEVSVALSPLPFLPGIEMNFRVNRAVFIVILGLQIQLFILVIRNRFKKSIAVGIIGRLCQNRFFV